MEKDQNKDGQELENSIFGSEQLFSTEDLLSEIDKMDPMERNILMDELAVRSDFWDEESEVFYE